LTSVDFLSYHSSISGLDLQLPQKLGLHFFLDKKTKQKNQAWHLKNYQLTSPNFRKQNKAGPVELFSALVPRPQISQGAGSSFFADGVTHDVTVLTRN
jgi:hypothetical protein